MHQISPGKPCDEPMTTSNTYKFTYFESTLLGAVNIDDEINSMIAEASATFERLPGPKVIKHFSCSTQLSIKFSLLINMKMPTRA